MSTRPAGADDADAIAELFLAAHRTSMTYLPDLHGDDETRLWIERAVLEQQEVWVAERDGDVVGFAAIDGDLLEHLYVHPRHQSRGVGAGLLELAKDRRPDGLRLHVFQQNEDARRFYERHGFGLLELGDGSGNEEGVPDALYGWRPIPKPASAA